MRKQRKRYPSMAEWLLKIVANKNNNSAIIGDLEEEYFQKVKSHGLVLLALTERPRVNVRVK